MIHFHIGYVCDRQLNIGLPLPSSYPLYISVITP